MQVLRRNLIGQRRGFVRVRAPGIKAPKLFERLPGQFAPLQVRQLPIQFRRRSR